MVETHSDWIEDGETYEKTLKCPRCKIPNLVSDVDHQIVTQGIIDGITLRIHNIPI